MSKVHVTAFVTLIMLLIASSAFAQTATPTPNPLSPAVVGTVAAQVSGLQMTLQANGLDSSALEDYRQQQSDALDWTAVASLVSFVKWIFADDTIQSVFGPFSPIVLLIAASLYLDLGWAVFYPGARLAVLLIRAVMWFVLFVERMLGEWGKIVLAILGIVAILLGVLFAISDGFLSFTASWRESLRTLIVGVMRPIAEFLEPALRAVLVFLINLLINVSRLYNDVMRILAEIQFAFWEFLQWLNPF